MTLLAQGKITGGASFVVAVCAEEMPARKFTFTTIESSVMPAAMFLYGGTLQLSARTDSRQEPERFSANIQLRGLDVGRMLAAAPGGMKREDDGICGFRFATCWDPLGEHGRKR